jgi:hypothetical protein
LSDNGHNASIHTDITPGDLTYIASKHDFTGLISGGSATMSSTVSAATANISGTASAGTVDCTTLNAGSADISGGATVSGTLTTNTLAPITSGDVVVVNGLNTLSASVTPMVGNTTYTLINKSFPNGFVFFTLSGIGVDSARQAISSRILSGVFKSGLPPVGWNQLTLGTPTFDLNVGYSTNPALAVSNTSTNLIVTFTNSSPFVGPANVRLTWQFVTTTQFEQIERSLGSPVSSGSEKDFEVIPREA